MPQLPNAKLLQAFEATARHGSITVAAQELFITQSALSRQIKTLEKTLRLVLFVREKNRLILTGVGRTLYGVLEKNLREIEACTASLQKGLERLTLKVPPSFATCWLAPRLASFYEQHPCLVSLHMDSMQATNLAQHYDAEIMFGHEGARMAQSTLLFSEAVLPAASPLLLKVIAQKGMAGIPVLHTLSGIAPLPYWSYWVKAHPNSPYVPEPSEILSGMEFATQEQAMSAAIEGLGVVMVDCNLASKAFKRGLLAPLGAAVPTPFRYRLIENQAEGDNKKLVTQFCQWIKKEAKAKK